LSFKGILEESEGERNGVAGCCICLIPVIHTYFIIKTFYCDVHFERGIGGSGAEVTALQAKLLGAKTGTDVTRQVNKPVSQPSAKAF
jgi:hypothetical protein